MITEAQAKHLGKNIAVAINSEQHGWFMAETGATRKAMIEAIREHLERSACDMLSDILGNDDI